MLLTDFVSIKTIRWIYVLPNNVKICVVKYFLLAIKHFLIFDLHFFRLYLNRSVKFIFVSLRIPNSHHYPHVVNICMFISHKTILQKIKLSNRFQYIII